MTQEPALVDAGLPIADALDRMGMNNIRHLIVTQNNRLVGVVSTRDLAVAASMRHAKPDKEPVSSAMSPTVYVCDKGCPLSAVAHDMEAHRYGCAVVQDDGRVVGIFTTTDALRALRQLVVGSEVEAAVVPTHKPAPEDERSVVEHNLRVGDSLYKAHVNPTAHQGMIR
jgi:acetoin utilization protein AcuB